MSKKNILTKEPSPDGKGIRITFENDDGFRIYEYRGASARAIQRGKDPADLTGGKLVSFTPKK